MLPFDITNKVVAKPFDINNKVVAKLTKNTLLKYF